MTVPDRDLTLYPHEYSLLTDLYELTMGVCYAGEAIADRRASFELFVRNLPEGYGYAIAMGLEQALQYLECLRFSPEQIAALQSSSIFEKAPDSFWSLLRSPGFVGDVWAVPEGTAIFAREPFLRIDAPLWQAQWVETYLLNTINYQTIIATKAARMRDMAGETAKLLEFGTRRAFSPQGAIWAARAALAAGLDSTSNVAAAFKLGCQPSGTMAHSLVMAIGALTGSEDDAFTAFRRYFPQAPLLIDTYDPLAAARRLADRTRTGEQTVTGVRIDSGDLVALSQQVRSLLPEAKIFASGNIDEWEIQRLQAAGAAIDGYGIGTKLVTGTTMDGVYKLVEIDGKATMKQSSSKQTYPGCKQIFRRQAGEICDRLGLASETPQPGETPLLQLVVNQGKRLSTPESLATIAERSRASVTSLPQHARRLEHPEAIAVEISSELQQLTQQVAARLAREMRSSPT